MRFQPEAKMTKLTAALRFVALVAFAFTAAPTASQAGTGSVSIEIVKAGFIVGVQGGRGTLRYGGKTYQLAIGGVSLGATIGASSAKLSGRVLNINKASDIVGTYGKAEGGVAVVTGAKAARLRNEKGVVLEIRGQQVGLEFSLDLAGMRIDMK
jgi:hypothetical protein